MKVGLMMPIGSSASPPRSVAQVRAFALAAEAAGFDSLWASDHLLFRVPEVAEHGAHDPWTLLSTLAVLTHRIELGTMVLGLRFRNPGLLAKMAVTLDEVSGGRLTLGVGAGWHDPEFEAFGYPTDHRQGRSEEALQVLHSLLRTGRATLDGRWVTARDAALLPPPARHIPLLVAGRSSRSLRNVARYGDFWNAAWLGRPDDPELVRQMAELDAACIAEGRDPASLGRTIGIAVRYPDATEPGPNVLRGTGSTAPPDPSRSLMGPPDDLARALESFARAGYVHAIIWLEPMDESGVERFAEAVRVFRG